MALKSHGVKAKKHLGQHFLNDEHVAIRLVESIQSARKIPSYWKLVPAQVR